MGRIKTPQRRLSDRTGTWKEFELIDWIKRRAAGVLEHDEIGIGDDASAFPLTKSKDMLTTCDALVENVHWSFRWCDYPSLAHKTVAVNVSDIAAMGGIPKRAHLVLALSPRQTDRQIKQFMQTFLNSLEKYQVRLVGGDTVASPGPMMINLTLQGEVSRRHRITRSQARVGDVIMVTGALGRAAAGLALLQREKKYKDVYQPLVNHLLRPVPRLEAARFLAQSGKVHSMMDISDGLSGDIGHIAVASKVGVRIFPELLPVTAATQMAAREIGKSPLDFALQGGEEYELLFTVEPGQVGYFVETLPRETETACHMIGEIVHRKSGLCQVFSNGRKAALPAAWRHEGGPLS